ncbi:Smr/MutS family protein [Pseudodesulfovibrio tunisiensis]|uniref:Smr/MutS family protein n=1 Tax=Pseudodesulfovibrio tunisiensis TaxID=463192 RepID=UPI001FB51325|nr:Smr/MutS family protein [Pseudodesulfovibrio tunisiensis]
MGKKNMRSLSDLRKLKVGKDEKDIHTLPYKKKPSRQEPETPQAPPDQDEEMFMAAMRGVSTLKGAGRQIAPLATPEPTQASDPEAEGRNTLKRIVNGDVEFEIEFTDEFMYGYVRGLDIKTFQRLKAGSLSVEAHLDLHGLNSDQAQDSLLFFLRESYLQNHRCVLIVTGRGRNSPGGQSILKRETQIWLTKEPLRRVILAFCTAQPKHGGAGALYVLLRKQRKNEGKVQWDRMMNWEDA